ncbi:hypothetical protein BIV59_21530 [Bacillus sp. MUM 13]|nr:hypothetical protein BIV59_21530 [Bacillus sp. MUM 13]
MEILLVALIKSEKYKTKLIVLISLFLIWIIGTAIPVMLIDENYILYYLGPDYSDYSFIILKIGLFILPVFYLCTPNRKHALQVLLCLGLSAFFLVIFILLEDFNPTFM